MLGNNRQPCMNYQHAALEADVHILGGVFMSLSAGALLCLPWQQALPMGCYSVTGAQEHCCGAQVGILCLSDNALQ